MDLVAVAIGGAIGAVARFAIGHWAGTQWPRHAHWATLCINALGSLVLGVVAAWMLARPWPEWVHRGVAIGLLGAFTTYSTFAMETVKLHEGERLMTAIGYVIATTVACVVLAAVGYWVTTKALR
jgi:CrcB protein